MIFKTTLIGNVGQDAEVKEIAGGRKVANATVAHTEKYTSNGEPKEVTTWVKLIMYGDRAEKFAEYVKKGKTIYVEGKIQVSAYMDKEGKPKASLEMVVGDYRLMGGKDKE